MPGAKCRHAALGQPVRSSRPALSAPDLTGMSIESTVGDSPQLADRIATGASAQRMIKRTRSGGFDAAADRAVEDASHSANPNCREGLPRCVLMNNQPTTQVRAVPNSPSDL